MVLLTCLTVFLLSALVEGAEKKEGDDEWVHLPNKCEGRKSKNNAIHSPPFRNPKERACILLSKTSCI
ncbi:unnamed protein product [Oncorhynchus mykiss]|uniref:Uncharacterized protein n=1 Tax=Oncorhynchus mykiss TaxID=8022 RepID=A0A060YTB1_ONCMY|nr:unnamed protein product [Oncorhynchus mykiss]